MEPEEVLAAVMNSCPEQEDCEESPGNSKEGSSAEKEGINHESDVFDDGIVDMQPPVLEPQVTRIPSTSAMTGTSSGPIRRVVHGQPTKKVYIRRRYTPAEELALYDPCNVGIEGKRIPAPPGKRGRRPIMLPHSITEPVSRSEAARRSGRPVVKHPSGVEFAIPSSLEAHPIQLSDTIPENPSYDILKSNEGMPYCAQCHCVLRSFHALEYHIMSVHLKYRPFRCMFCIKEYFYTEEETIAHLKSTHNGKPINIIRELKEDKEEELKKYLQIILVMIREDEDLSQEKIEGLQRSAYQHMQKHHRMRFKVPEIVVRQRSQKEAGVQTFVTMASPQTMVQMPLKSHFIRRPIEPIVGNLKVLLSNGEIVDQIVGDNNEYLVNRGDMEIPGHEVYDQIDVVEDELGRHVHYQ